ncbi:MAG: hypothetical protein Q4A83_00960 [Bacillota bacterium]|nr:hypothetical protein [Bacillota bacterium]
MKNKRRIAAAAVLAVFSALVCVAALRAPKAEVPAEEDQAPPAAEYYLRDCDGFIAVYRGASATPINITEIETATLNDTDFELLQKGIPAESRNELLLLLEDLSS